ncbi:hypothetical protein HOC73_01365, partial [bacterium]|nr:hypothetical protein [bacterium]
GWGLKGQISQYRKRGGRTETKNLSKQNLDDMENLISSRIKGNSSRSSAIVSRQDSLNIMKKAEELVKTEGSNFTRQDKEDLKNVVSTMRIKSRQALRSRPLNNTNELKNSSSTTVSDINEFLVD